MSAFGLSGIGRWYWLVFLVAWLAILICFPGLTLAQQPGIEPGETQSQPKTRSTQVTASVPDIVPPSAPILISPADGRLLTTNVPDFVFTGSQDNVGVDHYEFWLDGVLLFSAVATVNQTTSTYSLIVINNQFTLSPLNNLSDGSHTWKVVAIDGVGLSASSATWSFTIDTQAPTFVITSIDTSPVSISAQDVLTWPDQPIQVISAEPLLQGTGEANSSGVVRVSLPGQSDQVIQFTTTTNGEWQVQLPNLPFDTIMTLTFTITDQAGNVSVISDLQLIRPSIPLFPTPSIYVYPSLEPPLIPGHPTLFPIQPPFPLPQPIVDTVGLLATSPHILLTKLMPTALMTSLQRPTITIRNPLATLWNGLGLLWLLVPLLVSLVWLARFLPDSLSRRGIQQLLWAVGFWPQEEPQGIVFDAQTVLPIAFATVHAYRTDDSHRPYLAHRLCNRYGEYLSQNHPNGVFRLSTDSGGYVFPATFHPPEHQMSSTYYLGEEWSIDQNQTEPKQLVPMVPVDSSSHSRQRHIPPVWLTDLTRGKGKATLPQLLVLLSIAMFIPSALNTMASVILIVAIGIQVGRRFQNKQRTSLFRRTREPIQTAVCVVNLAEKGTRVRGCQQNTLKQPLLNQKQEIEGCSIQVVYSNYGETEIYEGQCSISKSVVVF